MWSDLKKAILLVGGSSCIIIVARSVALLPEDTFNDFKVSLLLLFYSCAGLICLKAYFKS